jgi:L-aspartate oxidase
VLIIGAGIAGLFAALQLAPLKVTILANGSAESPDGRLNASSAWAQGGIAVAAGDDDRPDIHMADTIAAGAGLVDPETADILTSEANARIAELQDFGVNFDVDQNGALLLGKEAAHSRNRIAHINGDRAGAEIMKALWAAVHATPSIKILSKYKAIELARKAGSIVGAHVVSSIDNDDAVKMILANATMLATGGIGALYETTTNPPSSKGEGLAMAADAGAQFVDVEFVQFHPTAIDLGRDPAPLATEALRGEGAILVDQNGRRFMVDIHPDAELAPRDVVARGITEQIAKGNNIFLDCREAVGKKFPEKFPTVHAACAAGGIDPTLAPIPVAPAAHYHMGGIAVDNRGRTSIGGLWASGEVACTGAHGANRLASNSLLEAIVFAARVADDIYKHRPLTHRSGIGVEVSRWNDGLLVDPELEAELLDRIRRVMTENVGLVRNNQSLLEARYQIEKIAEMGGKLPSISNAALAANLVVEMALRRKESRGGHYRSDFPTPNDALRVREYMTVDRLADGQESEAVTA